MNAAAARLAKQNLKPQTLGIVVLNVGDGDAIIVRFPPEYSAEKIDGRPKTIGAVIDCYNADKTIAALKSLGVDELAFICVTHPHFDHNKGVAKLVRWCLKNGKPVREVWDSGFRHVSKTHYDIIRLIRDSRGLQFLCPTSGFECVVNCVRVAVLSPSIILKNRYDTFGTSINNASIILKLEYPPKDISKYYLSESEASDKDLAVEEGLAQNTAILGGDGQFDAWARVIEEFPELVRTENRGQLIDAAVIKRRPLRCQVLKVPHHMSKHGISLEVIEKIQPAYTLASCADKSKHGFPHQITVLAVEDIKSKKAKDKGIRYSGHPDPKLRSGTIVALFDGNGKKPKVYGLGDAANEKAPLG